LELLQLQELLIQHSLPTQTPHINQNELHMKSPLKATHPGEAEEENMEVKRNKDLVEEQGEQAIHFGPQEVHTPPQHPQWKPRFGSSLATSPLPQSERETFFPLFPGF